MSLFNAIRATHQSTKTLGPIFDNIRNDDWYVSIGRALPDDEGLLAGGRTIPWPSPAHRAVWEAAQHGFTNAQYDDALRINGLPIMADEWTAHYIAPLSGARSIPPGRGPLDISNPNLTAIAGWSWEWIWRWDERHNVFYNPENSVQCFGVPRQWHTLSTDFFALPANHSIGSWLVSWSFQHERVALDQPEFRTPLEAALHMLNFLMAALCAFGGGRLDYTHEVSERDGSRT